MGAGGREGGTGRTSVRGGRLRRRQLSGFGGLQVRAGMAERTRGALRCPRCAAGAGRHAPRSRHRGLATGTRERPHIFPRRRSATGRRPLPPAHVPGDDGPLTTGRAAVRAALAFSSPAHNVFLQPPAKMAVPSRRLARGTSA